MIRNIIFFTLISIISGCGMMGSNSTKDSTLTNSNSDNTIATDLNSSSNNGNLMAETNSTDSQDNEDNSNILPQTISMDFPDILKQVTRVEDNITIEHNETIGESNSSSDINTTTVVEEDNATANSNQSNENINIIGYQQLRKNISQIADIVKIAQVNLVLLERVMPKVLDKCDGMVSCVFEPKFLSIVLDNSTISKINDIIDDSNITIVDNNSMNRVYLGEVSFKKDSVYDGYDYEIKLDMLSDNIRFNNLYKDANRSDLNITKKSMDYNKIVMDDSSEDENITDDKNITIKEYQIFKWSDYNSDVITNYVYDNNISIINVTIFYSIDEDGKEIMHIYNSNNKDGYKENMNLTLANIDDNSTIKLQANSIEQSFDGNETNISSFSSNGEISDSSSLLIFSESSSDENSTNINSSEIICDTNSSCSENNSTLQNIDIKSNIEFYQLKIRDGNLTDGSYVLLPPYSNINGLKLIDIFALTLGTLTISDGKGQGEIHNGSYNDMLDRLTIVKIIELQDTKNRFELIEDENRPILEIIK